MKTENLLQLEIITENSLANLKEKVNQFFRDHKIKDVSYSNNGLEYIAYIHYECVVHHPENIKDEYILGGSKFTCQDCPKWGTNYTQEPGRGAFKCHVGVQRKSVRGCNPACLWFYEQIAKGELQPYVKP